MKRAWLSLASVCAMAVSGCASVGNLTSIYRSPDIGNGDSLVMDAEQFAVLNVPDRSESNRRVCTMPSPDALAAAAASGSLAAEGAGGGETGASGSGAGAFSIGESAASIGLRTQSIQLLRDAMFRMCEAHANGAIDDFEFGVMMRRFQTNMVAILAIEQLTGTVVAPPVAVSASGEGAVLNTVLERRRSLRDESRQIQRELDRLDELGPGDRGASWENRRSRLVERKRDVDEDLSVYTEMVSALTMGDFDTAEATLGRALNPRSQDDITRIAETIESITLAAMSHNYATEMCYEMDRVVTQLGRPLPPSCAGIIQSDFAQRGLVESTVRSAVEVFLADGELTLLEVEAMRHLLSELDQRWSAEDLRDFPEPPSAP